MSVKDSLTLIGSSLKHVTKKRKRQKKTERGIGEQKTERRIGEQKTERGIGEQKTKAKDLTERV